jgi:23S rRNA pseudouridine2605 synthase
MTTEDWKPRYDGQNDNGQNRERRPYNSSSSSRSSYGNNQGGNYGRSQDNRGSYNRQGGSGNYDRRDDGGYNNRPRTNNYNREGGYNSGSGNYDRQGGGYNSRSNSGGNYSGGGYSGGGGNYSGGNGGGYSGGNYDRPQRSYDNQSGNSQDLNGLKKRRPRVGEISSPGRSNNNYGDRQGGYNSQNNRGGYQQRSQGGNNRRPSRNDGYDPNSKYNIQKQLKYREEHFDPNEPIRLNKYLANAGVCSRREADEFIQAGLVKVNGETVTELGTKVKRADAVMFHNEPIKLEHKIYLLLNKPKNCVTTADDPQERLTVMDLVKNACQERIFPVGRLDRNTTGVLLLTNDGDLSSKLTHPKFLKKKIYHVWLDKGVSVADMQKLADGIELEDGEIHADAISYVSDETQDQVGIEIHSGRNRIVRRMFESLGYHVIKLDRVYFAGLTKKNLKRGQWRFLSEKEVSMLRMGAFD